MCRLFCLALPLNFGVSAPQATVCRRFPTSQNMIHVSKSIFGANHRSTLHIWEAMLVCDVGFVVMVPSNLLFAARPILVPQPDQKLASTFTPVACDRCQTLRLTCRMTSHFSCDACYGKQQKCTVSDQPLG